MKTRTKPAGAPDDLEAARRVFEMEAEGIARFAASLGEEFTAALTHLESVTGRVIVTGMGKSGHVARKIAATFASTGTPAFFVHPAEASHGDLGMITRGDAVLALSNSGETPELDSLVAYTRRHKIPLIAVTGRLKSALAEAADVILLLPAAPEACPLGLAPTTSTTVMLALGDALAVALLQRKGFTADEFQVLHPGGQLGRKLLRVSDIMHAGEAIPLTDEGASMSDVLLAMTTKSFGCVGVLRGKTKLVGIVTDGDLRRHMKGLLEKKVKDVMTKNPKTIRPNALAAEALGCMNANKITSLFVVEDNRPVGILHIHDCLRAGIA